MHHQKIRNGHNPMRWDCVKSGCFNIERRPKIEMFCEALPGKISFGDVDGMVEINGFILMLEWKGSGGSLRMGQEIAYKNITRMVKPGSLEMKNAVFVINGDAKTMELFDIQVFAKGKKHNVEKLNGDIEEKITAVCAKITCWVDWVRS